MERTAGNVLISPLDDEDVAALLLDRVGDVVHPVAQVFDIHLLTGSFWSMNTNHQHVGACGDVSSTQDGGAHLVLASLGAAACLTCLAAVDRE